MIKSEEFVDLLSRYEIDFFTGVPDSLLKDFCVYLLKSLGIGRKHIIAPNEGNAVALAAGYYLATGKIGMVYMQNSGLGNAVNPITSLTDPKVYAIPVLYMIGWRGMPGMKDEPQHVKQGEITLTLLELLGIRYVLLDEGSLMEEINSSFCRYLLPILKQGGSAAFVIKKGVFQSENYGGFFNGHKFLREKAIGLILRNMEQSDVVIATTGKISREVYELRQKYSKHCRDFLTVGSMGHASMIALQIAEQKSERNIWCLDGDGALLMHTGVMSLIGARQPENFVHVLLNNFAHESVGGAPTVANSVDFCAMALACGYKKVYKVKEEKTLAEVVTKVKKEQGPVFIEIVVKNSSRKNLGRPQITLIQNKAGFMEFLKKEGEF